MRSGAAAEADSAAMVMAFDFLELDLRASGPNTGAGDSAAATAAVTPAADLRSLFFAPGALDSAAELEEPADEEPGARVEYLLATTRRR